MCLAQLVRIMHNICKVRDSNPDHDKKKDTHHLYFLQNGDIYPLLSQKIKEISIDGQQVYVMVSSNSKIHIFFLEREVTRSYQRYFHKLFE